MTSAVTLPPALVSPALLASLLGSATPPTVTLDGTAAALAALASSGGLVATVAPGPLDGTLALVTALGTFTVAASSVSLPLGTQVTLQGQAGQPGTVALVAITDPSTPLPSTTTIPPPTLLDLGTRLAATVIATLAANPADGAALSSPLALAGDANAPTASAAPAPLVATVDVGLPAVAQAVATATTQAANTVQLPTAANAATTAPTVGPTPQAPLAQAVSLAAAPALAVSPGAPRGAGGPATPPDGLANSVRIAAVLPAAQSELQGHDQESAARQFSAVAAVAALHATGSPIARWPVPTSASPSGVARFLASFLGAPTASPPTNPLPHALPTGTSLALRVAAIQAAGVPAEPGRQATVAPAAVEGVIRTTAATGATLDTAIGPLRLVPAPNLPAGTRVAVHLMPSEPATVTLTIVADDVLLPSPATIKGQLPTANSSGGALPQADTAISHSTSPVTAGPEAPGSAAARGSSSDPTAYRVFIAADGATQASARTNAVIGIVVAAPASSSSTASLIETPLGLLAVTPRLLVPPATLLLLELPDALPGLEPAAPGRRSGFENNWTSLQATLATLGHAAPGLAAQLHADLSAEGGEKLAAALLYLVATLRGGSGAAWPGAAIDRALADAGRADLAKRLGDDIGELQRIAAAPATAPWQVFVLPLLDGSAVRPIRLYLKRRGEGAARKRTPDDNSRFVLEFELSRLGTMQLDGFIRRSRFDLALRSHAPLAPALQAEVARIFHDRIAAAGLTGEIDFATVAHFPVAPLDTLRQHVGMAV